ncbi:MAG: gluconokinase [Actinobacteria bacterium]|nr:gluconokinase [Actinomycetota bacterium]
MKPLLVVMGVTGSGKSTIGELIASHLEVPFIDGDSLHPASNVAKMAAGNPLSDDDRWPWLVAVGKTLARSNGSGMVVACSALKRSYREAISEHAPRVLCVHLNVPRRILQERLEDRSGHFMPPALLDSQLSALEPLEASERGVTVDGEDPVEVVASHAIEALINGGFFDSPARR